MNAHDAVNDTIADTNFAAVWRFDESSGEFPGVEGLGRFDTFWYTFSLNNPATLLLE